jgi:hypothetical protein
VKRRKLLFTAALILLLGVACGGGDGGGDDENAGGAASERCENVPQGLVNAIASGLTVQGGGTLSHARAVKSDDYRKVYFISADIDGPGLEGSDDVGTWSKSGPVRVGDGLIFAVDAVANEFSDWGDGRTTDAMLSMEDDGAEESQDCVEAASR